jgi:hypothetical protein
VKKWNESEKGRVELRLKSGYRKGCRIIVGW